MAKRTTTYIAGALVGAFLFAAGCGDDDEPAAQSTVVTSAAAATTTAAAATTAGPETTEPASTELATPQRIVSLSATATEMVFAIGAGDQVIAVDSTSNYPAEAEAVLTDLSAFEPNVEAIAGYEPDLVVTSGDPALTEQLESLDIEVWEGPAAMTFGDAYAQLEQLGALTGHVAEAAELVANIQTDLQEIAQSVPTSEVPLTFYHELDDTLFSVTSATFIGEVYSLFGLQNIADQVEGDSGGFPQLNAEFVISEDPDLIFLADTKCCQQSLETVAARDGWADMRAVVDGNVIALDDDIASRWGPRVVDFAQTVADALESAFEPAGGG
ncbi:MAG: ABC transporter substrate-binding protein [Ilumatobacteraceae bacterium]